VADERSLGVAVEPELLPLIVPVVMTPRYEFVTPAGVNEIMLPLTAIGAEPVFVVE